VAELPALVMQGTSPAQTRHDWSFDLRPVNGHTRLIRRNRFGTSALPWKDKLAYPVIEPGLWVMERKMLLTIKQRAERLARTQRRLVDLCLFTQTPNGVAVEP
jgi:hypothetical protein